MTSAHTAKPRMPFAPFATPSQTTPATAQPMLNVPNNKTTFSLPRIASLNFSTKGIRVCWLSFQKFAMCVRARNVAAAFARAAPMSILGVWKTGIAMRAVDVRKLTSSYRKVSLRKNLGL